MTITRLFKSNRSQAVRLPREFAFPEDVREVANGHEGVPVVIAPAQDPRPRALGCPLGAIVQEAHETHPELRETCGVHIFDHAKRKEVEIAAAKASQRSEIAGEGRDRPIDGVERLLPEMRAAQTESRRNA